MIKLIFFELKRIIKSKSFILSSFLISLLLLGITFVPKFVSNKNISTTNQTTLKYDYSSSDFKKNKVYFENKFENYEDLISLMDLKESDVVSSKSELKKLIEDGTARRGIVFNSETEYEVIVKNNSLFNSSDDVVSLIENFNFDQYLKANDINPSILKYNKEYNINGTVESLEGKGSSGYIIDIFIMIIFYGLVLFYGSNLSTSMIHDKRKGIYETLYSFANPIYLTISKVISYSVAGIIQFIIFLSTILIGLNLNSEFLISEGFEHTGKISIVSLLVYFIFIILGFLFYLSIYSLFASFVRKEDKAINVSLPILIILAIAIIGTFIGVNYIEGQFMYIMSLIPFSSMIVAPLVFALTNMSMTNIITSGIILVLSTTIVIIISAYLNKRILHTKK